MILDDNKDSGFAPEDQNGSVELDREEIPPTDITFDCPHCGKNLSIDPRGAGLVISCTRCGESVTVPIPEGLEIDDFDATPEELSIQLLNARQKLARAEERIIALDERVISLKAAETSSKNRDEDDEALFAILRSKLDDLSAIQGRVASLLREISTLIPAEK